MFNIITNCCDVKNRNEIEPLAAVISRFCSERNKNQVFNIKKKQLRQQNAMLTNIDLIKSLSTRVWKVVTPPAITE